MAVLGPFSAATNFSLDLEGSPDTRPGTWGDAGSATDTIQFENVPAGNSVRILRVYGDFIAWPKGFVPNYGVGPAEGNYAAVSWGLLTTAPGGSQRVNPAADNAMVWIQQAVRVDPVRAPFDFDTSAGGLLQPDNKLQSQMAVFLNTIGLPIHMEATFVIVYQYESAG
ncbi:MAG TPA: hypothetical protein VFA33_06925 [Bryobacteraceae bacterium]|nr:hypothetical protein [Bryobacteraceae bacterium]